jgi:tetratricopeptide (TPR) repeat protein
MKNKEKKQLASQFPNIYRFITETKFVKVVGKWWFRLSNQAKLKKFALILSGILVFWIILVLSIGIIIFGVNFVKNYNVFQKLSEKRQNLSSQISFWQSVSQKYPGYKDAYFQIAILEYQLGDLQSSEINNQKALILDPNFENAIKLEKILNKK